MPASEAQARKLGQQTYDLEQEYDAEVERIRGGKKDRTKLYEMEKQLNELRTRARLAGEEAGLRTPGNTPAGDAVRESD